MRESLMLAPLRVALLLQGQCILVQWWPLVPLFVFGAVGYVPIRILRTRPWPDVAGEPRRIKD